MNEPLLIPDSHGETVEAALVTNANSPTFYRTGLVFPRSDSNVPGYSVMYCADDGHELYVGRIFKLDAIEGLPWMWTVDFHQRKGRAEPHEGHVQTEDEAKAAWKRCWESADVPIRWPPTF